MKHTTYLPFLGLLCIVCFACERPKIDNTDNGYPIELTALLEDDGVKLSWTTTNISTFESYTILRSTDSISDDVATFFFSGDVLANVSEVEESSFTDENIPFAEYLYYKVVVDIGSRVLLSPTVRLDNNVTVLPFRYNSFFIDQRDHLGYFYDLSFGLVYQYDFINEEFPNSPILANSRPARIYTSEFAGGEVYFLNGTSTLSFYSQNPFQYKGSLSADVSIYDEVYSVAYQNDFLFLTKDDYSSSLQIYDRASEELVTSHTFSNSSSEHLIVPLPGDEHEIIIAGPYSVKYYDFNEQGGISFQSEFTTASYSYFLNRPIISPDGEYVIPFQNGLVFQTNPIQQIGTIPLALTTRISSVTFSEDGTKIFVIPSSSTNLEVEEYSFPELELLESHTIGFNPDEVFVIGSKVYMVGSVFLNGSWITAIETITID